jgi:hypothetical protein
LKHQRQHEPFDLLHPDERSHTDDALEKGTSQGPVGVVKIGKEMGEDELVCLGSAKKRAEGRDRREKRSFDDGGRVGKEGSEG